MPDVQVGTEVIAHSGTRKKTIADRNIAFSQNAYHISHCVWMVTHTMTVFLKKPPTDCFENERMFILTLTN